MRQRGRLSSSNNVVPLATTRQRVPPPDDLSATERKLFNKLTATCPHLVDSDFALLQSFVQATLLVRKHRHPNTNDEAKLLHTACKIQVQLATKLRLAPQTRIGPKTTARRAASAGPTSAYDLLDDDDEPN